MTDTNTATVAPATAPAAAAAPVAPAPAPAAPVAAPAPDLQAQIAALQAQLAAVQNPAATHGVVKLVGFAALRAWWTSVTAAVTMKNFVACASRTVYRSVEGLKTLLVFAVTGGLALVSEFNGIDLTPLVSAVLPAGAHLDVAQVITLMSVLGILLRLLTSTPVFRRAAKSVGGAADSNVDTPVAG